MPSQINPYRFTSPYANRFITPPTMPASNDPYTFDPNKFGQNITLPPPAPPQPKPSVFGPEEQPIDFGAEYGRIGNKYSQNRLAYQQAIEQGAPEIQRSKWAKLGAILASGAAGMANPRDIAGSYNLGRSSYMEPQMRSDEAYEKKVKGLGTLAQFEESDKANEIRALEMRVNDQYKRKEDKRQDKELELRIASEERAKGLTEEQIAASRESRERAKWNEYQDVNDGNTYLKNRVTGEKVLVGKTALTSTEQTKAKKDALMEELKIKEPFEARSDARKTAGQLQVVDRQNEGKVDVANIKDKAAAERMATKLEAAAKVLKPGDKYGQAMLEIAAEMRKDPSMAKEGLLTKDEMGMPKVTPDSYWTDSEETTATKAKLRGIFEKAFGKAAEVQTTSGVSKSGSLGGDKKVDTAVEEKPIPDAAGKITITSPDGKETKDVPIGEWDYWKKQGALLHKKSGGK